MRMCIGSESGQGIWFVNVNSSVWKRCCAIMLVSFHSLMLRWEMKKLAHRYEASSTTTGLISVASRHVQIKSPAL